VGPVPIRCPVPSVPSLGTTLMIPDPFEYHLYRLYHPRNGLIARRWTARVSGQ
jgi:hypothetical protein